MGQPIATAVTTVSAISATIATRKVLSSWYRKRHDAEPPEDPTLPGVGWAQALTWGLAVGAGVGVARVVARRLANMAMGKTIGAPA